MRYLKKLFRWFFQPKIVWQSVATPPRLYPLISECASQRYLSNLRTLPKAEQEEWLRFVADRSVHFRCGSDAREDLHRLCRCPNGWYWRTSPYYVVVHDGYDDNGRYVSCKFRVLSRVYEGQCSVEMFDIVEDPDEVKTGFWNPKWNFCRKVVQDADGNLVFD